MPAVIPLAAAAVTAGASIYSSSQANKAAKKAAKTQQQGADAAIALDREQFTQGRQDQMPWLVTGSSALSRLAQTYGLDYQDFNPNPVAAAQPTTTAAAQTAQGHGPFGNGAIGNALNGETNLPTNTPAPVDPMAAAAAPASGYHQGTGQGDLSAFFTSPDYQFRMQEGLAGVTGQAAALGGLDSGATRKALIGYAGNQASGEFNNYANRLAALAGVGQTTATNMAGQGAAYANSVGNIYQNNADNQASSYLAQGRNNANLTGQLAGIGSGLIMNWPTSGGGG
jgi:hypothetical protein